MLYVKINLWWLVFQQIRLIAKYIKQYNYRSLVNIYRVSFRFTVFSKERQIDFLYFHWSYQGWNTIFGTSHNCLKIVNKRNNCLSLLQTDRMGAYSGFVYVFMVARSQKMFPWASKFFNHINYIGITSGVNSYLSAWAEFAIFNYAQWCMYVYMDTKSKLPELENL